MRKSGFQRDDVSTEGTNSPVLGQDLEHELFPHPLKMSKSTFPLGLSPHVHIPACQRCLQSVSEYSCS